MYIHIHEIILVPILFVLKINWNFPLMSFKLFVCMDMCIQYCETIMKGTHVKAADKFHSKQFCSKMPTSYSPHQLVCLLQHWTNVCLYTDFMHSSLPAFRTGARRVKLYVGGRWKARSGKDSKTNFSLRKEPINRRAESWST